MKEKLQQETSLENIDLKLIKPNRNALCKRIVSAIKSIMEGLRV